MSGVQCNNCGSTNIDTDSPCGNVVCIACGNVLDEANIVQEVQFLQNSRGVSRAVGQHINFEDGIAFGLGQGFGSVRESRAVTIHKARRNIQNLAARLQLKAPAVESALNYYKLALTKHLTKGRRNEHVIAACVYMVCRKDGTSHMLLDLSDALQINVYELGKTYLKLSTELHINTPVIDPVLYIARFARQLQFGDKENEVAVTATKLVRRMKSDWMHFGRRPSGLCGAALLVAARLHNFNRTIDDIIKVVKVCQATVRKRLSEFGDTPSGKLSIDDFLTVDLSEEQDPPSFKNARRKLRELENEDKLKELESQVTEFQKQIENILENTRKKSVFAKYAELNDEDNSSQSSASPRNVDMLIAENTLDSIKDVIGQDESEVNNLVPVLIQEGESITESESIADNEYSGKGLTPTLEFIGLGSKNVVSSPVASAPSAEVDDNLDLTGIDDSELDIYFMKPSEYMKKDEVWHKFNADYLEELKAREERRALEEEENAKKPPRKKRAARKRDPIQANSAGEAMSRVFQQKKISHKLNYDILKSLTPGNCLDDLVEPETEASSKSESNPPSVKSVRVRPKIKPAALSSVHLNIKRGMSDIIGSSRQKAMSASSDGQSTSEGPSVKKARLSESTGHGGNTEKDVFDIDNLITKNHVPVAVEEDEAEEDDDSEEEYGFSKDDGPGEDVFDYDKFVEEETYYD